MARVSSKTNYKNYLIDSPILIHYFHCCREHEKKFYNLVKHDFKNNQNSVLMALDLFRLKGEAKYLDIISEASYKSLNYIDQLKKIEPHLFISENIGFYSCPETIQKIVKSYPKTSVSGENCFVFADSSFSSVFEMLLKALPIDNSAKLLFHLTSFSEGGFLKCRIDLTIPASIPQEAVALLVNPESSVTGDIFSLSIYTVRQIINRYSGHLSVIENSGSHSVLSIVLYQESDEFKSLLLKSI